MKWTREHDRFIAEKAESLSTFCAPGGMPYYRTDDHTGDVPHYDTDLMACIRAAEAYRKAFGIGWTIESPSGGHGSRPSAMVWVDQRILVQEFSDSYAEALAVALWRVIGGNSER